MSTGGGGWYSYFTADLQAQRGRYYAHTSRVYDDETGFRTFRAARQAIPTPP